MSLYNKPCAKEPPLARGRFAKIFCDTKGYHKRFFILDHKFSKVTYDKCLTSCMCFSHMAHVCFNLLYALRKHRYATNNTHLYPLSHNSTLNENILAKLIYI
jgi:hypothetical protein